MRYNNNMIKTNDKYSWDSNKRELIIKTRGLDFVVLADFVFADPDVIIYPDNRRDYGEYRYLAYAMVADICLCLCFTHRDNKIHLITIFRMHKKQWRKKHDSKK